MREDAEKLGRGPFGYGRLLAPRLDCTLVQSWLRECQDQHSSPGSSCRPRETLDIQDLVVIDTIAMCIAEAPKPCRFLALSYCWGTARVFRLVQSNRKEMETAGSIRGVWNQLPATVRDAITLCRDLGERYLWVDSLCIVQDDDAHRSAQIAQMNKIYHGATLTIVCTDGTHADAGLAGVGEPRSLSPATRLVRGMTMAVPLLNPNDVIDGSSWDTRAWTYQERCLSRRLLCVTGSQVFFICGERIFCEDTVLEDAGSGWYHDVVRTRPARVPRGTYQLGSNMWSFPLSYQHHLQGYTRRRITYQTDILDAFLGVMGSFPQQFWQGLPEVYIDAALLWTTTGPSPRRPGFPSWSWSGWIGEVDTPLGSDIGANLADFQSAVEWYIMNGDGDIIRLHNKPRVGLLESFRGDDSEEPPPEYFGRSLGVSRPLPTALLPRLLPIRDVVQENKPSWRNPPFLMGWLRVAMFELRREPVRTNVGFVEHDRLGLWPTKETNFCVIGPDHHPIGRVVVDGDPDALGGAKLTGENPTQQCEIALLSRTWRSCGGLTMMTSEPKELLERVTGRKGPWPLVNVVLIKRVGGAIAQRTGVGFIHEEEWEAAKHAEVFLTLQ